VLLRLSSPLALLLLLVCSGCKSTPQRPSPALAPSTDPATQLMSGEAWIEYCERIQAAGLLILGDDFPGSEAERAAGFRHLARTVSMGLQWEVDFADADFPAFYRHNDDVTKWGGPNVDNGYLRARIDGTQTYRLTGQLGTIEDLIISTSNGDMHDGRLSVAGDFDSSQLALDEDGRFELLIGPDVDPETGIRTPPDHVQLGIRQYFNDWETESPAIFHIERVGAQGRVPAEPTPASMALRLDAAATWVERVIPFWNTWMQQRSQVMTVNRLGPPMNVPGGSSDIFYGGGRFELEEDEALIIETTPPDARYWSFQWYTDGWFESPDFGNRQSSLNGTQTRVDPDGRIRIVVARRDPGVQNWIDVGGQRAGLLNYRWIWSTDAPTPSAEVVPLGELRAHLPAQTPPFSVEDRARQIDIRRRHVERRFRR